MYILTIIFFFPVKMTSISCGHIDPTLPSIIFDPETNALNETIFYAPESPPISSSETCSEESQSESPCSSPSRSISPGTAT